MTVLPYVQLVSVSLYIEESSSSIELNECASMKHPVIVECYHVSWLKSVVDLENSDDSILIMVAVASIIRCHRLGILYKKSMGTTSFVESKV